MKRKLALVVLVVVLLVVSGCGQPPHEPANHEEREPVSIYGDGQSFKKSGYTYDEISGVMTDKKVDGTYYYAASLAEITGEDISSFKGAFLESNEGLFCYVSNLKDLYLAAYYAEGEEYVSFTVDGEHVYGGVFGGVISSGVTNVYLVSTPADFAVEIQVNSEKIGELTLSDFLEETPMNGTSIPTAMFDGSFMYDGGASTHEGRFLGVSYEVMLAKLNHLGLEISGDIIEVEYYGNSGLEVEGKNEEYSRVEGDPKYFGSVDFICMFDGMTYNHVTDSYPIGLTAFINGTGGRWMTHNLTAVNFITE